MNSLWSTWRRRRRKMPVLDELEYVSISLQKILSRLTILKFSLKMKRWMSQGRDIVTQIKVKAVAGEGKKESLQGIVRFTRQR